MKEHGPMINKKERALKHGIMVPLDMKVTLYVVRRLVKEDLILMVALTQETSLTENSMATEGITSHSGKVYHG